MAAEKGYDHVVADLEYPRGGRSWMDWDPEGQSRGYDMTSMQTVPGHIAGMLAVSCWKRKLFPKSDRLGEHVGKGLHPHCVGL